MYHRIIREKLDELLICDKLNDPDIQKYTGLSPLELRKYIRLELPHNTQLHKLHKDWFISYNKEYHDPKQKFNHQNLIITTKRYKKNRLKKDDIVLVKKQIKNNVSLTTIESNSDIDMPTIVAIKQKRIGSYVSV